MDEVSLQFHIEQNDLFGTVATVLDLVSQNLQKQGDVRNTETLLHQRDRLMHLQRGYRIEKIEPSSKKPACHYVPCSLCQDRRYLIRIPEIKKN